MVPNHGAGGAAVTALIGGTMLAALIVAGPAEAMNSCTGTYAAGLLHPVPPRTVVGLDIFDNSDRNIELGKRFMAGVASAGVTTAGKPTALLRLTTQFSRSGDATGATDGDGGSQARRSTFGNVGNMPSLPDLNSGSLLPQQRGGDQNSVVVRAQLMNPASQTVLWIASVQCVRQTTDDGTLAYDLGRLIGRSIGKRVERGPV